MSLSKKGKLAEELVTSIFSDMGYIVELAKPLGAEDKKQYADIIAVGPDKAFIIELKTGRETGSSDVMQMRSYVEAAQHLGLLEEKRIEGIIITGPGTLVPAQNLSREWGIKIIEAKKNSEIKENLQEYLSEQTGVHFPSHTRSRTL